MLKITQGFIFQTQKYIYIYVYMYICIYIYIGFFFGRFFTKTHMFLKVEALKSVRARCFEIAKRSSSIEVSNSSQNDTPRQPAELPELPDPGHGLQVGTYHPHAPESG